MIQRNAHPVVRWMIEVLLVAALSLHPGLGTADTKAKSPRQQMAKTPELISVRALSVPLREVGVFTVADLEKTRPAGWELAEFSGRSSVTVERMGMDGHVAVRLKSDSSSFSLHRKIDVDGREYPYLTWVWRVERFPQSGDIRRRDTDDQAAQVYVIFPRFPAMLRSQILGYVWDSRAPVGTILASPVNPMARVIVIRSGPDLTGGWIREIRNVAEDYRRVYGGGAPRIGKVSLLINSQHTKTVAESLFADIAFLRMVPREWAGLLTVPHPQGL